jgi:hypothetical protein
MYSSHKRTVRAPEAPRPIGTNGCLVEYERLRGGSYLPPDKVGRDVSSPDHSTWNAVSKQDFLHRPGGVRPFTGNQARPTPTGCYTVLQRRCRL